MSSPVLDTTAAEIIQDALLDAGIIRPDQTPAAEDVAVALARLNSLTKHWQAQGNHLWAQTEGILFLDEGTQSYFLGPGGDEATTADDFIDTKLTSTAIQGETTILVESTAGMEGAPDLITVDPINLQFWTVGGEGVLEVTSGALVLTNDSTQYAEFDGSAVTDDYASSPSAGLAIVPATLSVIAKVAPSTFSGFKTIISKYQTQAGGVSSSFLLRFNNKNLRLTITTDGTPTDPDLLNIISTSEVPFDVDDVFFVAFFFDGPSAELTFYTSSDGVNFQELDPTISSGTTTDIFNGTEPIQVGMQGAPGQLLNEFEGRIYDVEVRDGDLTGDLLVQCNFNDWSTGTTFDSSTTGETWTLENDLVVSHEEGPAFADYTLECVVGETYRTRNGFTLGTDTGGATFSIIDPIDESVLVTLLETSSNDAVDLTFVATQTQMTFRFANATGTLGLTSILTSLSQIQVDTGDNIGIKQDDNTRHWTNIVEVVDSTTLLINAGMASGASSAKTVFTYTNIIERPLRLYNGRSQTLNFTNEVMTDTISRQEYMQGQTTKDTQSAIASSVYYDPSLVNGRVYIWGVAKDCDQVLKFTFDRPLQVSTDNMDSPDFPSEWRMALKWNLAEQLLTGYSVPPDTAQIVMLNAVKSLEEALSFDEESGSLFVQPYSARGRR